MTAITQVLDTSAILAHYFDEAGADMVERLWSAGSTKPAICAVTITELRARLKEEIADEAEALQAADAYLNELTVCLPVDRAVAEIAWQLKESITEPIPLIDALIAATARAAHALLVHRDPHLERIPRAVVDQIVLPARAAARG
jgi:predicted nucleic acid-binding protein